MRETSTIPAPFDNSPESERTSPHHDVPMLDPLDILESDAPAWAKQIYSVLVSGRKEEKALLARIERNQKLQIKELRRLSHRVAEHNNEIEDVRQRVSEIESRVDEIEADLSAIQKERSNAIQGGF